MIQQGHKIFKDFYHKNKKQILEKVMDLREILLRLDDIERMNKKQTVTIGDVVTKDVPPYSVVAGNPARVVKYRFTEDVIKRFLEVKWWDLPEEQVIKNLAPHTRDPIKFLEIAENLRAKMFVKVHHSES